MCAELNTTLLRPRRPENKTAFQQKWNALSTLDLGSFFLSLSPLDLGSFSLLSARNGVESIVYALRQSGRVFLFANKIDV